MAKSTILIDSAINLTGLSDDSVKRIKKMISENILADNTIKLNFDKNGQAAMIKQLGVAYDQVSKIQKLTTNMDIGGTSFKMMIKDFTDARNEVIALNKEISNQETIVKNLQSKANSKQGVKDAAKAYDELEAKKEARARYLKGKTGDMFADKSLTGEALFSASNLKTSALEKTSSTTKLVTVEKQLNDEYKKQERLTGLIAKHRSVGADVAADERQEELFASKKVQKSLETKLRKTMGKEQAEAIITKGRAGVDEAGKLAKATYEGFDVKKRISALNELKGVYRELLKEEIALAKAEAKYNASVVNQSAAAKESIDFKKKRIAALYEEEKAYLAQTNIRTSGDDSTKNTEEYNKGLKEQERHLENVQSAQKAANVEYSKSNKLFGIMNENFKTAAARIIDYTLVYRSLWMVIQQFQKSIQTVMELDKAFTDIQMVTGYNTQQINALEESYSKLAKTMGATVTQVAEGERKSCSLKIPLIAGISLESIH